MLVTSSVHGWYHRQKAKDKSEEKEIKKTKHGPSSRTATAEGQRLAADSINSNVLEDLNLTVQKTHCEGSTHNKLESSPHAEDQIHPLETSKPVDKAEAPKTCSHKITGDRTGDAHTAPYVQHSQTTTNKGTEPKTEEKLRETSVTTVAQSHPDTASPTICSVQVSTQASQGRNTEDGTSGHGQSQDSVKHKPVFHEVKGDIKSGKAQIPWQKNTKCTKSQESCETAPGTQLKLSETDTKERVEDIKTTREEGSVVPHKEGETVIKESCPSQTQDQPQGATLPDGSEPGTSSENVIDDCPPPPAPFSHRIVSIKQAILSSCYTVCQHELLGGGRFGQVHKCVEKSSGLRLAAKIIKVKGSKDRDEVKNEINVMNQLNHVNLIQLYDAFECRNDLTLIMEYLDGGELFDRITDENYNLTELDAIMFTRQICEGIYYLHQQYILHLDLKPENILCVSRTGNQIKIIDFGLARRYKPREKLKVNFGTPEFLAPEVVNYDFVSFPTDMWSIGVITYMLLSGLSPFLGESDAETMNYIVNCNWDFDSEAFDEVSEEAKDFVSKLMVKEKSGRLSAGQCLKHEWLVNLPLRAKKYKIRLKSQILLQRYLMQRKWKKHFYVVAAANRLRKFHLLALKPS
ncbi:myosin light chain kinase 3 isoform 2-T2 [Discoglossus pictus]